MSRNLKATGLALLLVTVAATALMAGNASAEEEEGAQGTLTAAEYPATLDGTEENAVGTNAFTIFGEKIVCNGSTFSGSIAKATTTITLTPTYNNCSAGGGGHKVTITMNGCDFVVHIEGTTPAVKDNYYNSLDIICPLEHQIEIHKYVNASNELLGVACLYTIGEQKGLLRGKVTNDTTNKDLLFEKTYKKITAKQSGACGANETTTGEYDVSITLKGTNSKGAANALEITD
jgi:uncharacterized protein YceK